MFDERSPRGDVGAGIGFLLHYTPVPQLIKRNGLAGNRTQDVIAGAEHAKPVGHVMQPRDSFGICH